MISDPQQEQAALYALGLLDADEAGAFERQIDADADLRELVRDLREAAAALAWVGDGSLVEAPAGLRERVLEEARANRNGVTNQRLASRISWLPWALAALFMGCTVALGWLTQYQKAKVDFYAAMLSKDERFTSTREQPMPTPVPADALAQVSFCALEPTPDFTTAQPRAAVLWDAAHHQGKLRVNRLAPPAEGKDYQLWTVEAGRKDTVSAGVVHVDADGKADISFQPVEADGRAVVAVAISLERAGGSPTNQGPVLLLGKF